MNSWRMSSTIPSSLASFSKIMNHGQMSSGSPVQEKPQQAVDEALELVYVPEQMAPGMPE